MSRKGSGHFCWSCGRVRPNEKFSGRGHARHLCRDCARLGPAELAFRQTTRDIDGLFDWSGRVKRSGRQALDRFLAHSDDRVRLYAEGRVAAGRVPLEKEEAEGPQNAAGADDEAWAYEDFIDLEPDSSE